MTATVETNLDVILKAGQLLVLSHGAYSDRRTLDPVRVTHDVGMRELAEAFKVAWESDVELRAAKEWFDADEDKLYGPGEPPADMFLPWLVRRGHVEAVDRVRMWHIGSYSDFDPKWHHAGENDNA